MKKSISLYAMACALALSAAAVAVHAVSGGASDPQTAVAFVTAVFGAGITVTPANLNMLFKGYSKTFSDVTTALRAKKTGTAARIYMEAPSGTSSEVYGWLKDIGGIREWLGDRVVKSLEAGGFEIVNKQFEETVGVKRTVIEDDKFGIYTPRIQQMAQNVEQFPDTQVWKLARAADTTICYDGQYLCDTDHPYIDATGALAVQSNWAGGAGERWFLIDSSRMGAKPFIVQPRERFNFRALTDLNSDHVFKKDEYLFGTDGRYGFGPGFWQLIYGSRQTLNTAAYAAARAAMLSFKRDGGEVLNVMPDLLVCGPSNEAAARAVVQSALVNGGESNPWANTAQILVVPELG